MQSFGILEKVNSQSFHLLERKALIMWVSCEIHQVLGQQPDLGLIGSHVGS